MDRKELVERRKHRRFPVKDLTFAVPRKNSDRIGKVVDIGMGGLAFHYSGAGEWSDKSLELDIFRADSDFYLTSVGCRLISDREISGDFPDNTAMRRSCVEFNDLAKDKISQLEELIHCYAAG